MTPAPITVAAHQVADTLTTYWHKEFAGPAWAGRDFDWVRTTLQTQAKYRSPEQLIEAIDATRRAVGDHDAHTFFFGVLAGLEVNWPCRG